VCHTCKRLSGDDGRGLSTPLCSSSTITTHAEMYTTLSTLYVSPTTRQIITHPKKEKLTTKTKHFSLSLTQSLFLLHSLHTLVQHLPPPLFFLLLIFQKNDHVSLGTQPSLLLQSFHIRKS